MNKHYDHWLECKGTFKILDCIHEDDYFWIKTKDSIFYVEGGGMVKDTGTINGIKVEDIKYEDGYYYHKVSQELSNQAKMSVDVEQRINKVQVHSASHLICGHMNKKYHAKTIAFFTHEDTSGCEMEFSSFDYDLMKQIEREVNDYVLQDLAIDIVYPTREEAQKHVLDEKLEHDELRAAVIGDIDYNMCGCIHVPSLRYLQSIKFLSYEKTTRGYKIFFVCGDQLLHTYDKQLHVLEECAKDLGCPQFELYEGIQKLHQEIKELKNSEAQWKQKVMDMKIASYTNTDETYLVSEIEDMDVKTFTGMCSTLVRNHPKGIFFVCHVENRCHVVIARNTSLEFKANELFKQVSTEFNLRGGGNPAMAQGGGEYSPEIVQKLKAMVENLNNHII